MRKFLEWTPVGSFYTLADWVKCLREPIGWTGALIGVAIWLILCLFLGFGDEPVVHAFAAAFGGTIWWIWVSFGRANGHGRSIVGWSIGLTLFMMLGALSEGDKNEKIYMILSGLLGGALVGAIVPTSWLRMKGTAYSFPRRRRAQIALALPQIRLDEEDYPRSVVAGCEPFQARSYLAEGWGVKSTGELQDMLKWLCERGHQQEVTDASASPESASPPLTEFLEFHRDELQSRGISAWDLGRAAQLVRWGVVSGYLTFSQAWEHLSEMESLAKLRFGSWEDYGRSYILGARYWYAREGTTEENAFATSAESALSERRGLWRKLPW